MKDVERYEEKFEQVKEEMGKVIVGYEDVVEDFLICLMTDGHLLLEGVPGIAKTTMIKVFAKVIGLEYNRVQFTQDLLPADILGHYYYNQKENEFELRKGPVFAQVLMADEINRAPPKTQSALIEAMQEKQATIQKKTLRLPEPFLVIATMNPVESEGVYTLPEAQLDRFMIKSDMGYISPEKEHKMLKRKATLEDISADELKQVKEVGDGFGEDIRGLHRKSFISEEVLDYIHDIVIATRDAEGISLGASPRAGEHLVYTSQAYAVLNGRDYVLPDDVKTCAMKVLPHRLITSMDARLEDLTERQVLRQLLREKVEAPKGDFNGEWD